VSRYEGLGTTLTGGPPPVGSKPVGLRKDSTGSNASLGRDTVNPRPLPSRGASSTSMTGSVSSSSWKVASPEPVQEQFSEPRNLSQQLESPSASSKPSTPTQPTVRAPFKPIPPSASPQTTNRSRYSVAGPPLPSAPSASASTQEQEGEEKFAGVRNMKSRWESMSKPKDEVGRGDKRKSWAQI
jgi:hypothetical protein